MSGTLVVHSGGWNARLLDLDRVLLPQGSPTYTPVPYVRLIEEVRVNLPRFNLGVAKEEYALAREGQQMFAVLTCRSGEVQTESEWGLAIGIRSSYDRSLSVQLVAGSRVFVCDNLAFSGEVQAARKHTVHVLRDLPQMIYRMLDQVAGMKQRIGREIAAMKGLELSTADADHLILEALRRRILSASRLPKVLEAWGHPQLEQFVPRTAWSLFNAFTEVAKGSPARAQMDGSLRLTQLFRSKLELN